MQRICIHTHSETRGQKCALLDFILIRLSATPFESKIYTFLVCEWTEDTGSYGYWSVSKKCACVAGCKCARMCVWACAHVFFCKCQNKETVQWKQLPTCAASQCWPLEHAGMLTHTHTHLFSQQAQLSAARVPFAQVPCRCDHRADTAAVRVGGHAVHLPALFWAWVQTLDTSRSGSVQSQQEHHISRAFCTETSASEETGAFYWFSLPLSRNHNLRTSSAFLFNRFKLGCFQCLELVVTSFKTLNQTPNSPQLHFLEINSGVNSIKCNERGRNTVW